MPKRQGYLYNLMEDEVLLLRALYSVLRRKKSAPTPETQYVIDHETEVVQSVLEMLRDGAFVPAPPRSFTIEEGVSHKLRLIQAPKPYPDQIVHWAIILAIDKIFYRGMYRWSCGSIPGRGQIDAVHYVEKHLRSDHAQTNYKYCLKMDIHHFFQSVDHDLLMKDLRHKIKDQKMLALLNDIIMSVMDGLPIGYYTSQWLANFYLEPMDHYIKEQLKARMYVRYVDDLVICDSNKKRLHLTRARLENYLEEKRHLELKGNWQVFRIAPRGIDFCGFRMFYDRTTIRKAILSKIRTAIKKVNRPASKHALMSMLSYYGYLDHSDSYTYMSKYVKYTKDELVERIKKLDHYGYESERAMLEARKAYRKARKERDAEMYARSHDLPYEDVLPPFGEDQWDDMMDLVQTQYGEDPANDVITTLDLDHLEGDDFCCGLLGKRKSIIIPEEDLCKTPQQLILP